MKLRWNSKLLGGTVMLIGVFVALFSNGAAPTVLTGTGFIGVGAYIAMKGKWK